jgi:hypothetical protein
MLQSRFSAGPVFPPRNTAVKPRDVRGSRYVVAPAFLRSTLNRRISGETPVPRKTGVYFPVVGMCSTDQDCREKITA